MIEIVGKLIARRLLTAVPILLAVSALLFCVLRVLPVDPAAMSLPPTATLAEIEAKRHEMGLDKPLPEQYVIWLADALHGRVQFGLEGVAISGLEGLFHARQGVLPPLLQPVELDSQLPGNQIQGLAP